MDLLFVMDPLASVNSAKDTTYDLMEAAQARGHRVFWCEQTALRLHEGRVLADAIEVEIARPTYREKDKRTLDLAAIGATLMRKDPPVDAVFTQATLLLLHATHHGARVYNRPDSLLSCNEKLYALRFPEWTPDTLVTSKLSAARAFAQKHGKVVLKPLDGNGGKAVFVAQHDDSNFAPLVETLSGEGRRHFIVQQFLREVGAGDKRIILVNGEPAGALNRIPAAGEHRANMHVGGTAVLTDISETEKRLCAALKPNLLKDGLLLVGIDVIGNRLTEVNVTSPTGVQEIRALSGIDVSPRVIAQIENK